VNIFETLLLMVVLIVFPIRSSYGQTLVTSTFSGETLFSILISISGLVLFSHLIGNMQVLFASFQYFIFMQHGQKTCDYDSISVLVVCITRQTGFS
jgi:hypothetical protein